MIVGGKGKKADIDKRVAELKAQRKKLPRRISESKYRRGAKLEKRIAKLTGGVAVIRVGAATETEMKYLKDKIEDAVNATKAAIAEGIVPGGGSALAKVAAKLQDKLQKTAQKQTTMTDVEWQTGYAIVIKALRAPFLQIVENAGREDGILILDRVSKDDTMGWDAVNEVDVDMIEAGIIDPVKVTRSGVENAASAAAVLLTTEAAVADIPEDKKGPNMPSNLDMAGMD